MNFLAVAMFSLTQMAPVPTVTQTMPEIAPNEIVVDHFETMVVGGEKVKLRDQHLKKFNETNTEAWTGIIYFDPATDKFWFALIGHHYAPQLNKKSEIGLFEYKNDKWVFVHDITEATDEFVSDLLQKRYSIRNPPPPTP